MARARDIKNLNNKVIAVIGDGALTGGMALEAINDAGISKTNLIVILNDNEMSISKNTGGMSRFLSKLVHDIALPKLGVVICIDRAGCVGNDGETHQGLLDLSYLLTIPNMTF